jgi:hypothetical protein
MATNGGLFMFREKSSQTIEATPAWRDRLKMKASILAGAAALGGAAVTAVSHPASAAENTTPTMDVGFSTNRIFDKDLSKAEAIAQQIQSMGGTVVRIFYPLNKNTAWENYRQETCNAVQAAYDHGLQPIFTFVGYDLNGRAYVPETNTEIRQFATTEASIFWNVASNKDGAHPGGCVPQAKHWIIEGINEPNNDDFNRDLGDQTPAQMLQLDARLSEALKKEAAKPEIGATVEYGEALAVGNHDVVKYLSDQAQAKADKGINNPYDFIDIHAYPKDPTADPSETMKKLYGPIKFILNQSFKGSELVWGEEGVNTTTNPLAPDIYYYNWLPSRVNGVSEATQAKYMTNILKTASQEGSPWVTFFSVQDDGGGSMVSSGVFYNGPDPEHPTPKSSQPAIRYQIGKYTGR